MNVRLARLGAIVQLLFAAILGIPSWLAGPSGDAVPGGIVLLLVYGLPGVIGLVGTMRGSRVLLAAAALADLPGSIIAFSGVSLLFLVPALLMGSAVFGGPFPTNARRMAAGAAMTVLLAALMVGAGASMLFLTRYACWIATDTPSGTIIESVPDINGVPMSSNQSGGCSSGAITVEGVALGLGQGAMALAIAHLWTRRREPDVRLA